MDELVTIIVPVYNKIGYIKRCVASIMDQTYYDLQIILVDDGSTDGSGEICDAVSRKDTRIEVIHRENGGVSAARNTGLDRMRGSWLAFADADDYVSPYYIEDMLAAVRDDCEMVMCCPVYVKESESETAAFRRGGQTRYITGREACMRNFGYEMNTFSSIWGKLFRARQWDGLRFPEGKINEDMFISHELLYRAGYITLTDSRLYAYVLSRDSIMRGAFTLQRLDILDAWQKGVRFFSDIKEPDLALVARRVYCCRVFDARCICKKMMPREREAANQLRRRAAEAYRDVKAIRRYADCSSGKALAYRLKLLLGRWFPPLYSLIFVHGRAYI